MTIRDLKVRHVGPEHCIATWDTVHIYRALAFPDPNVTRAAGRAAATPDVECESLSC
jgi:hypothetical protein